MRVVNGIQWVDDDVECAAVLFDQVRSIRNDVVPFVHDFSVCVQAGGNCGLFPLELALLFDRVVTAEPDPVNFEVLRLNTIGVGNIDIRHCALGNTNSPIRVVSEAGNCGASYIDGNGIIPQNKIDDLALTRCGLIYLDVEGFEEFTLRGAERTIKDFRPIVVVEAKGLSQRYGRTDKQCAEYLSGLGYDVVHKFDNDVVWRCHTKRSV